MPVVGMDEDRSPVPVGMTEADEDEPIVELLAVLVGSDEDEEANSSGQVAAGTRARSIGRQVAGTLPSNTKKTLPASMQYKAVLFSPPKASLVHLRSPSTWVKVRVMVPGVAEKVKGTIASPALAENTWPPWTSCPSTMSRITEPPHDSSIELPSPTNPISA
jgi:hypothetical protein